MAHLYYHEGLTDEDFRVGEIVEVAGEEARHAVRVARLRVGERQLIGNGCGVLGSGEVTQVGREHFLLRLHTVRAVAAPQPKLVLVQALAKGGRDERAVEQATEFGVDAIIPWQAERSVSRWSGSGAGQSKRGNVNRVDPGASEKPRKGVARWEKIAREAAKQSVRAWIPEVRGLIELHELCQHATRGGIDVLLLHPRADARLSDWARDWQRTRQPDQEPTESVAQSPVGIVREIWLVSGPEGGMSESEIAECERAGARMLRLGDTVLRTSSAGPAALVLLSAALERW